MPRLPDMTKHRGFPSGLPGTGLQFTIRRANPKGVARIFERARNHDRAEIEKLADTAFLHAIWHHFGGEPFERGNLDAGRINWLFGREIVPAETPFDPQSYEAMLRIDEDVARRTMPEAFADVLEV
ncbi:hypothetical protein CSC94_09565 [Zhengella mangrovi]|uniref:Uncharacterized protein n=1 Tax=Zhengella mangrovi TaxID=1982044 RepID=A0A2G1QP84_9HYPH|nr:hypothetical protein [Zhengella mangrovi]PHP67281.1 hypothetical protein CSC94_09565 [Zhengella mangrovi]